MFNKPSSYFGVGINFRREISEDIIKNIDKFDFIEVNTESFFNLIKNSDLDVIAESTPISLHGLSLSIGTYDDTISDEYLKNLSNALGHKNCIWFSEHMAVTHVNDVETRSLMPISLNDENIDNIIKKTLQIKAMTNKPFLLENITYYYTMPNSTLNESYFISEIVKSADCGLLLDINNLHVNSINHKYDPYEFLNAIPLDRVVEIHLAGCDYIHGILIDTHASKIKKEVLSLFEYVIKNTSINGVVIERDDKLDNFMDIITEVETVKEILTANKKYRG